MERTLKPNLNLVVASEPKKNPTTEFDYRLWYCEINAMGNICSIRTKTCEELIESLFWQKNHLGESFWRVLRKGAENTDEITFSDFISINQFENTHFGNLPTLSEFERSIDVVKYELRNQCVFSFT